MRIIDNINDLLGDDLKVTLHSGTRLKIAASCFSIYAYEALKDQLEKIDSLEFIFTAPTFVEHEVSDTIRKERREFHIPSDERERSFYGSEFEIQLKNKLTQKAIARECAGLDSPKSQVPIQQHQSPHAAICLCRTKAGSKRFICHCMALQRLTSAISKAMRFQI